MGTADSIEVEVALFATLRKYRPDAGDTSAFRLDVPGGTTVDGLMGILGIPATETKQVFAGSQRREGAYVLQADERVAIFPPVAGG